MSLLRKQPKWLRNAVLHEAENTKAGKAVMKKVKNAEADVKKDFSKLKAESKKVDHKRI